MRVEKYRGVELLMAAGAAPAPGSKAEPDQIRVAFLDANTILAGDRIELRMAIDRIKTGKLTASRGGILAGIGDLVAANDLWMVVEMPASALKDLLAVMAERSARPLGGYSKEWKPVTQTIVDIAPTKPAAAVPPGMVQIPKGDYEFFVRGIEIEGGNDPGVDVQYPWEDVPRRFHQHRLHVPSFHIDRTPVTNAEFSRFLEATRYRPQDDHNFLRDWKDGRFPEGWANKPVTWVLSFRRTTSRPVRPGIRMSRNSTSGSSLSMRRRASGPSPAIPTMSSSGHAAARRSRMRTSPSRRRSSVRSSKV
jgi:hypothetical protein